MSICYESTKCTNPSNYTTPSRLEGFHFHPRPADMWLYHRASPEKIRKKYGGKVTTNNYGYGASNN